ncbi:MAG: T9SS type A sorting domain-containing protein [Bacteroidota bacterium]
MKNTQTILKITLINLYLLCAFSVNSQCIIDGVTAEITACEGDLFDVSINFEFDNTSDQFTIAGNGNNYGTFNYNDLPVTLTSLAADCDTEYEFVVTDVNNNDCSDFVILGTVCCDGDCVINGVDYDGPAPECIDGFIVAQWFIFAENTSEVGFDIFIENDFLTFVQYNGNGPYEFDIPDTDTEFFTLKVCDNDNPDCCHTSEWPNPCYEEPICEIGTISYDILECENDLFDIVLNFEYVNTSSQFTIVGNGVSYGTFAYNNLPITLEGLEGDCITQYEFIVTDVENNDCSNFTGIGTVCCGGEECFIGELDIEVSECDGDEFFVIINFEYENTSDEFFVNANGTNYGPFTYANLPVTIDGLESNCDAPFEFLVYDSVNNGTCASDANIGIVCCEDECQILSIDFGPNPVCEGGFIVTEWFIFGENTSEVGYDIYINGEFLTFVQYNGNGPYEFDIEDPGTEYFTIKACDNDNPDCCYSWELMNPCYENNCFIGELEVEVSECDGNFFFVEINFEHENTGEQFKVSGNGIVYGTYSYADLPIIIDGIESNCNTEYEFVVEDLEHENCVSVAEIGTVCCEDDCQILSIDFGPNPVCEGGFIVTEWFIFGENTSEVGYDIYINGEFLTFVQYNGNGPYEFDIEDPGTDYFTIKACDNDNPDCCYSWEVMNPCFDAEECFIGELDVDVSECDGNFFFVVLDFEYENTSDQFKVFGNGNNYGTYSYSELPITIDGLESDCNSIFELIVSDVNNNDCASDIGIEDICCEDECQILSIDFGPNPVCEDGFIVTEWFIFGENTSESGYDIYINGEFLTFVQYNGNGPYEFDIEDPGTEYFTIKACDNDNPDCCYSWELMNPCYDPGDCDLYDLVIETSECDGGVFEITFDFEYSGTTNDFFDWEIPGYSSGTAEFSELPYTKIVQDIGVEVYELIINENDNPDCSVTGEFENPCFESEDCFIGEIDIEVSECDGNLFFVVINFEYANTSDEFKVVGNGNNYGTFSYTELPITIDGLEADCDLEFEFIVADIDNNDCASDVGIGEVCCDGDDCDLFDLVIETSECDEGVFEVTFDFEYSGTTNDYFDWEIPGYDSGFAEFGDLPLTLTIQNTNMGGFGIFINENDNPDCAVAGEFENPCFESEDCFIGELDVDVSECDGNFFYVEINFEYANTSNQFKVVGNGNNYGSFSYDDLPIQIEIESDCDLQYEFGVQDLEFNDCGSAVGIGEVCCDDEECDLFELDFDVSECDGDYFVVVVDFEYVGNSEELFVWEIPGIGSGTESFADLPMTIEIENTTESQFTFFANEIENPDCGIVGTFGNPCYDDEACTIDGVTAEVIACEEDLFDVEIDFDYDNVSNSFTIVGNGVEYGSFEYDDLPVILTGLNADCELEYEFVVKDNENEECSDFVEIGTICCEDFNQINGMQSETIIVGEIFNITFDIINTTLKGCNIDVYIDDELLEVLGDDESLFTVGPFECGQEGTFEIKLINSCSGAEWKMTFDLSEIECITDVEVTLDSIDLIWNMDNKSLSLEGQVPVSVDVQVINTQGALLFAEKGVSIGWSKDLQNIPGGLYFVRIIDSTLTSRPGFIKKIVVH